MSSTKGLSGALVRALTTGTITSPDSMARNPALMGEVKYGLMKTCPVNIAHMQPTMIRMPDPKLTQTDAAVVRFHYRPYRKGARKAPARAPQDMPMSWAMKVTELFAWTMAMAADITMKKTTRSLSQTSLVFSAIPE